MTSVGIPGQPVELPTYCGRKSCVFGFTVNRQDLLVLQSNLFINVSLVVRGLFYFVFE